MQSSKLILMLIFSCGAGTISITTAQTIKPVEKNSPKHCDGLMNDPFFEIEMVIGKPWKVIYTWGLPLEDKCVELRFKIATPRLIRRFYYETSKYLEEQPAWGAASLVMIMGKVRRQILMFNDQGPAGKFLGVPNILRDGSVAPIRNTVPLMKFHMKLTKDGQYLLLVDCMVSVASLAVRFDHKPNRTEVVMVADKLAPGFGHGHHACKSVNTGVGIITGVK